MSKEVVEETIRKKEKTKEYHIVINAVYILSHVCGVSSKKIFELLTGWCWDEEEVGEILALKEQETK